MLWVLHNDDVADGLPIRKANRDAHLAYLAGFDVVVAGPLLDQDGGMKGSLIIIDLPDRAAVDAFIANDPYTKAKLTGSSQVSPFKQGLGTVSLG